MSSTVVEGRWRPRAAGVGVGIGVGTSPAGLAKIADAGAGYEPNGFEQASFEPVRETGVPEAGHAKPKFDIEIATGARSLDALWAEWETLITRFGDGRQVFQTPAWCRHWSQAYAGHGLDQRITIATAWRDDRLALVLPLMLERAGGITTACCLGAPVAQYGDLVGDPQAARDGGLDAMLHRLKHDCRVDVLHLRKVRADSPLALGLARHNPLRQNEACAFDVAFGGADTFEAFEQRYPAKARKNRRRLLRRLNERGPVAYQTGMAGTPLAVPIIANALAWKRAWLTERGLVSRAFADGRLDAFLGAMASQPDVSAGLWASSLACGPEMASVQIGFICGKRLSLHVIAYDPAFERDGAGVLHQEATLAWALEHGFDAVDFLAPAAPYKEEWATGSTPIADMVLPLTLKGHAYVRIAHGALRSRAKTAMLACVPRMRKLASLLYLPVH